MFYSGSAVFNILFVIGMCALFSKTVKVTFKTIPLHYGCGFIFIFIFLKILQLTWWPLFRDCSFYSIALITYVLPRIFIAHFNLIHIWLFFSSLIICFSDYTIEWWEALLLLCIYIAYVTFMKFNQSIEGFVKRVIYKNKVTRVSSSDQLVSYARLKR
jgi:sodium/potassium/calcium exchanger 2